MKDDHRLTTDRQTGALHLYDRYQPGISGGSYRLLAQQEIALSNGETHHYLHDQAFQVAGPRFTLPKDSVQTCFPPDNGIETYGRYLPYIVLRERALPWERSAGTHLPEHAPWMALLVLTESEFNRVSGVPPMETRKSSEMYRQDTDLVLLPALKGNPIPAEQTEIHVANLTYETFMRVAPRPQELPLLAHLRGVGVEEKAEGAQSTTTEFSVVCANRFPNNDSYVALLVSMEGWGDVLAGERKASPDAVLRLILLHHWRFTSSAQGDDTFAQRCAGLDLGVFGATSPDQESGGPEGFTLLKDADNRGDWYRGPLTSDGGKPPRNLGSGEDISYAAAFQLGRMLALSSSAFAQGLRLFLDDRLNHLDLADRLKQFVAWDDDAAVQPGENPPALGLLEWLARLVLLHPVPLHYLVPDAQLLPNESLRFFKLDNQWVHALLDGALGTAVQNRRDLSVTGGLDFASAISQVVYQRRMRALGRSSDSYPTDFMSLPKTGFLLRSSVLTHWPGTEFEVEIEGVGKSDLPPLLRLDNLGNGLMFGLARGIVKRLVIKEPRETMRLGRTSAGDLQARDPNSYVSLEARIPVPPREDAAPGIVDVLGLQRNIAEVVGGDVGSATLALQMLTVPEAQAFVWQA